MTKLGRPRTADTKRAMYTIGLSGKSQALFDLVQKHIEAKAGVTVTRAAIVDMMLARYMKEEGLK